MAGLGRGFVLAACVLAHAAFAQAAPAEVPPACASFLGAWSGTWSQGQYGKQRIHVTHVSEQCIATLAYSPTEAMPERSHPMQIRDGVIAFACNVPFGTCRIEVVDDVLRFTYKDPSGLVNVGTFRRDP